MNVLSLFDGISCARVALDRAKIEVNCYLSSEIEKNAIKVSEKNYPDIIRVGSVVGLEIEGQIDLLIGGSPCTDLSIAKKDRKGLEGEHSSLFWEYVRIKKECKPTYFILENVASMPKADKDIITREMGVEPVMFNASLVSAQSRKRLFWTNIPFTLPDDKGILLKDILQPDGEVDERMLIKGGKSACIDANYHKGSSLHHAIEKKVRTMVKVGHIGTSDAQANRVYDPEGKSVTLSAQGGGLGAKTGLYRVGHIGEKDSQTNRVYSPEGKAPTQCKGPGGGALPTLIKVGRDVGRRLDADGHRADEDTTLPYERRIETRDDGKCGTLTSVTKDNLVVGECIRKLTPIECERLQGLPDNYTEGIATTNRYKCLGNAFNVDVVAHILSHLK